MDDRTDQFQRAYAAADGNPEKLKAVCLSFPDKWADVGRELASLGEPSAAIQHLEFALQASSNNFVRACAFNEIGRVHANAGQTNAALGLFDKAHYLKPNDAGILTNIGLAHRWLGNLKDAERWLNRALKVNPWEANAALELSFVKMLGGDYLVGFEQYESRFRMPGGSLKKLECDKLEWDGNNGQNVFIYGEQGSGDIFLMLRYAKLIRERGVRQSWVVHKSMLPLVKTIPEIDFAFADGADAPEFDCHFPAASLPRLFKTTLDSIPPALCIPRPPAHDYGPGFHVGIVWRGSKSQNNDAIRSTNLSAWKSLLDVPGVTFHSLQVDGAEEGLAYPQLTMHEKPADWMETARRVCGMDLVVSVDTSMVHLCGSLGVPCWVAMHCRPYFVFPLVRDDCPWYPSVRLFKQSREFEWQPVFERIAKELCELKEK